MLTKLRLVNFKAFKDQSIDLKPLTLLAGINGMGKSSVLQALILLRQSFLEGGLTLEPKFGFDRSDPRALLGRLVLRGDLLHLGTGKDVLFEGAEEDRIGIQIAFKPLHPTSHIAAGESEPIEYLTPDKCMWIFNYDRNADTLSTDWDLLSQPDGAKEAYATSLFTQAGFHYLEAERSGPRTFFDMSDDLVKNRYQLGSKGQYAPYFLHVFSHLEVNSEILKHPKSQSKDLVNQVEAWLGEISPGTRLKVVTHDIMDLVQLSFAFERGRDVTNYYRATNVGFGITYTMPIIVALLSLTRSDLPAELDFMSPSPLVLLENPEAHLHPRGQSKMGELLARASAAGIQVIVETHSDHILNGIRIAVKKGILEPENVGLNFFQRPPNETGISGVEVVTPHLDGSGRLDFWPDGFFDEWDNSLDELLS